MPVFLQSAAMLTTLKASATISKLGLVGIRYRAGPADQIRSTSCRHLSIFLPQTRVMRQVQSLVMRFMDDVERYRIVDVGPAPPTNRDRLVNAKTLGVIC